MWAHEDSNLEPTGYEPAILLGFNFLLDYGLISFIEVMVHFWTFLPNKLVNPKIY